MHTGVPNSGALLAIEVGADRSSVVLVERVENSFRFVARAEHPSTHRPPQGDALPGIYGALRALEQLTGRQLLHGDTLIRPQRPDGSGVDAVVATTSDLPVLAILVLANPRSLAAQQALAAARSLPGVLLGIVDPRDAGIEQRLAALPRKGADVVVAADPDAASTPCFVAALERIARQSRARPLAVVCGPEDERFTALEHLDIAFAAPSERGTTAVEPVRAVLRRRLRELLPARVPGLRRLAELGVDGVGSSLEDEGLMLRFLATHGKRTVWLAGVDGTSSFAFIAGKQIYDEAIAGQLGLRTGAAEVLRRRGADAIARWLPEVVPAGALRNTIMNRTLRPALPSVDDDDLALDLALLREALVEVLGALAARPLPPDLVIGGGALASCPRPALAALALLDVLPAMRGIVELSIDRGMLAAAGALARVDPTAGASLVTGGTQHGEALATAVLVGGAVSILPTAARIELTPQAGTALQLDVRRGDLVRMPLARGKRAELRVRFAGVSGSGAEERREVSGSTLGIVVDARTARPGLPAAHDRRVAALKRWLAALEPPGHDATGAPRPSPASASS